MRNIVFDPKAFKQFNQWATENKKLYRKIVELIDDTLRHPFSGLGKPEPLKHALKGYWSRRINDEHRLVYIAFLIFSICISFPISKFS